MLKKLLLVSILSTFLALPVFVLAAEPCNPQNGAGECALCESCDNDDDCSGGYCAGGESATDNITGMCQATGTIQLTVCNPLSSMVFTDIIGKIIGFITKIALGLAPLMAVIGGFMIVTSTGDPKKVDQGKKIIIYTGVGFLIILFANGIVSIIDKILE